MHFASFQTAMYYLHEEEHMVSQETDSGKELDFALLLVTLNLPLMTLNVHIFIYRSSRSYESRTSDKSESTSTDRDVTYYKYADE